MQIPPIVYEVSKDPAPFKRVRPQWLYWLLLLGALMLLGWLAPATRYVVSTICIGLLALMFASATVLPTRLSYALSGNGVEVRWPKGKIKDFIAYEEITGVELILGATSIKHKRGVTQVPALILSYQDFHGRLVHILEAPPERRPEIAAQPVSEFEAVPISWSPGYGRGVSENLDDRPFAVMNREHLATLTMYGMIGPFVNEIVDIGRGKHVYWGVIWLGATCILIAFWMIVRAARFEFYRDHITFRDRWSKATFGYDELSSIDCGFWWLFRAPGMKPVWFSPFAMADLLAFVKRKKDREPTGN